MNDYAESPFYRQYIQRLRSVEESGSKTQLSYSTFEYKGVTVTGECPAWTQFSTLTTRLPFKNVYYSSLTLISGAQNFDTGVTWNNTFTCRDRIDLNNIMTSLNDQQYYNGLCDGTRFRIEYCPDIGLTFCAGCKTICRTDWCKAPVTTTAVTIQPCQSCQSRRGFYQIMDLQYTIVPLYPIIHNPIVVTSARDSMQLMLNVSGSGRMFCAASMVNDDTVVNSPYTLKAQGVSTTILSSGIYTVNLNGLHPSTDYNVYCYTEDFAGSGMEQTVVDATKVLATTTCCPEVVFLEAPASIPSLTRSSSLSLALLPTFSLTTDASNLYNMSIHLYIQPNFTRCSLFNASVVSPSPSAVPNVFTFTPSDSVSQTRSFVVNGDAGCYILVAKLMVDGQSVSFTNRSLNVLPLANAVSAPRLSKVALSADGFFLIADFDTNTDSASGLTTSLPKVFTCSSVLKFSGAASAKCTWTSNRRITATLPSTATVTIGSNVTVVDSTIRSYFCTESLDVSTCLFSSGTDVVYVTGPSNPVVPTVSLSAPATAFTCQDLSLDMTNSYGNGNRAWTSIQWIAVLRKANTSTLTYPSDVITTFLNSNWTTTDKVAVIPKSLLLISSSAYEAQITLTLTTFLGQTNRASVQILLSSSTNKPEISILGPNVISSYRANPLTLRGQIAYPACYTGSTSGVKVVWAVYRGYSFQSQLVSQSNSPSTFYLPAFSLQSSASYTVQLIVTTSTGVVTSTSVLVQVLPNTVVAVINGGAFRTQSILQTLTLDGSSSYSYDYPTNASMLAYSWSCVEITFQYYGESCIGFNLLPQALNTQSLSGYLNSNVTRTLSITLQVQNRRDNTKANTTQVVELLSQRNAPIVLLNAPLPKYNPGRNLVFTAKVIATEPAYASWSVINTIDNTSAKFLVPTLRLTAGTHVVQQSIVANTLVYGGSYLLRLFTTYGVGKGSYAQMTVNTNVQPSSGIIIVSPQSGTALNTTFLIRTYGWQTLADNYPLTYTQQYLTAPGQQSVVVQPRSAATSVEALVGSGVAVLNYDVTCTTVATDILGTTGSVSTTIKVYPPTNLKSSALLTTLESMLSAASVNTVNGGTSVTQIVAVVTQLLNTANCSLATSSYCASLHRQPCSDVANTCGSCQTGFIGVVGSGNTMCKNSSVSWQPTGALCSSNDDCVSNQCVNERCVDYSKQCPNQCSGRGTCVYASARGRNGTNDIVTSCKASNPYCEPTCQCNAGYHGADCSLATADYNNYQRMRSTMCHGIDRIRLTQDGTADMVRKQANMVTSLLVDATQVADTAVYNCSNLLLSSIENYATVAGDEDVRPAVLEALQRLTKVDNLPLSVQDRVVDAFALLSKSIETSQAVGEPLQTQADTAASAAVRFGTGILNANTEVARSVFTSVVPQTAYEASAGQPKNSISLTIPVGATTVNQGVGLGITEYAQPLRRSGKEIVSGQVSVSTKLHVVDASIVPNFQSQRRRLDTNNGSAGEFTISATLQNIEAIEYFVSIPVNQTIYCLRTGVNHTLTASCPVYGTNEVEDYTFYCPGTYGITYNFTCPIYVLTPFCAIWNGVDYIRTENGAYYNSGTTTYQCFVTEYSATNTSCQCRLAFSTATFASVVGAQSTGSTLELTVITETIVSPFVSLVLYTGSPAYVEVAQSVLPFVTSATCFLLFVVGFITLYYSDEERRKKVSGIQKYVESKHETTGTHLLVRNHYYPLVRDEEVRIEAIASLADYATHGKLGNKASKIKQQQQMQPMQRPGSPELLDASAFPHAGSPSQPLHSSPGNLHNNSGTGNTTGKKTNATAGRAPITMEWFLNSILPVEYTGLPWQILFQEKLFEFHDVSTLYLWVRDSRSYYRQYFAGGNAKGSKVKPITNEGNKSNAFVLPTTTNAALDTMKTKQALEQQQAELDSAVKAREEQMNLIQPESQQQSLRWVILGARMVNIIFWTSVFVSVYFSNNGQCETSRYEDDCIRKKTLFGVKQQCVWDPELDTACSFRLEAILDAQSMALVVLCVLFLTSVCTEPLWRMWMTTYQLTQRIQVLPLSNSMMAALFFGTNTVPPPSSTGPTPGPGSGPSSSLTTAPRNITNNNRRSIISGNKVLPFDESNNDTNNGYSSATAASIAASNAASALSATNNINAKAVTFRPYDYVTLRLRPVADHATNMSTSGLQGGNTGIANNKNRHKDLNKTSAGARNNNKGKAGTSNSNTNNNAQALSLTKAVISHTAAARAKQPFGHLEGELSALSRMTVTRHHVLRQYLSTQRAHPWRKQLLVAHNLQLSTSQSASAVVPMVYESSEEEWGAGSAPFRTRSHDDMLANMTDSAVETRQLLRQQLLLRRLRQVHDVDRALLWKAARLLLLQARSDRLTARRETLTLLALPTNTRQQYEALSNRYQPETAVGIARQHLHERLRPRYLFGALTLGALYLFMRDLSLHISLRVRLWLRQQWLWITSRSTVAPSTTAASQNGLPLSLPPQQQQAPELSPEADDLLVQQPQLPPTTQHHQQQQQATAGAIAATLLLPSSWLVYAYYSIVRRVRIDSKRLRLHVSGLDRDLDRDTYLLQLFLTESLPYYPRLFAQAHLHRRFTHVLDSVPHFLATHPLLLSLYLLLAVCSLVFMMAYVFVMSLRFGATATPYWLVMILLAVLCEWIFYQPIRLYVKWIWVGQSLIAPQVRLVHGVLKEKCGVWMARSFGMMRSVTSHCSLVQHTSVACRLARMFPDLPASRILVTLQDLDVDWSIYVPRHQENWMQYRLVETLNQAVFGAFCLLWAGFVPSFALETSLDIWTSFLLSLIIVGWSYLYAYISVFAAVGVCGILFLGALWILYSVVSLSTAQLLLKAQVGRSVVYHAEVDEDTDMDADEDDGLDGPIDVDKAAENRQKPRLKSTSSTSSSWFAFLFWWTSSASSSAAAKKYELQQQEKMKRSNLVFPDVEAVQSETHEQREGRSRHRNNVTNKNEKKKTLMGNQRRVIPIINNTNNTSNNNDKDKMNNKDEDDYPYTDDADLQTLFDAKVQTKAKGGVKGKGTHEVEAETETEAENAAIFATIQAQQRTLRAFEAYLQRARRCQMTLPWRPKEPTPVNDQANARKQPTQEKAKEDELEKLLINASDKRRRSVTKCWRKYGVLLPTLEALSLSSASSSSPAQRPSAVPVRRSMSFSEGEDEGVLRGDEEDEDEDESTRHNRSGTTSHSRLPSDGDEEDEDMSLSTSTTQQQQQLRNKQHNKQQSQPPDQKTDPIPPKTSKPTNKKEALRMMSRAEFVQRRDHLYTYLLSLYHQRLADIALAAQRAHEAAEAQRAAEAFALLDAQAEKEVQAEEARRWQLLQWLAEDAQRAQTTNALASSSSLTSSKKQKQHLVDEEMKESGLHAADDEDGSMAGLRVTKKKTLSSTANVSSMSNAARLLQRTKGLARFVPRHLLREVLLAQQQAPDGEDAHRKKHRIKIKKTLHNGKVVEDNEDEDEVEAEEESKEFDFVMDDHHVQPTTTSTGLPPSSSTAPSATTMMTMTAQERKRFENILSEKAALQQHILPSLTRSLQESIAEHARTTSTSSAVDPQSADSQNNPGTKKPKYRS